jgi:hypothetical protein
MAPSQRGIAAAKLANMRQGERTDLGPQGPRLSLSIDDAAKMLKIGSNTVKRARVVLSKGSPELIAAVELSWLRNWISFRGFILDNI